jgi:hypothetical protein
MDTSAEGFRQMKEQIWQQDQQRAGAAKFRKALEQIRLKKTGYLGRLALDGLPEPPGNNRQHHPGHQRPEHQ